MKYVDKEAGKAFRSVVPVPAHSPTRLPSRTTCVLGFSFNLRNSTPPLVHDIDMDVCSVNSIADGGAAPTEDFDSLVHLAAHCPGQLLSSPPSLELRNRDREYIEEATAQSLSQAAREDGDLAGGLE